MAEYTLPQATKNMDQAIRCIEMHTTGEPTRIVYAGYPALSGTLLEQRALASEKYDHLRRRLILEPRGHRDMYGAVLRQSTELVDAGLADIGVIFMTNDGYSNMCGHATIALGRFLIDTFEVTIFPKRKALQVTPAGTLIRLHAPSGIVEVTVQTLQDGRSDPSKPVSFLSVPSFATGWDIRITVPPERRWHVGREVETVSVNFAYGGAFFCMVDARRLYSSGQKATLAGDDLKALEEAAFAIRDLVNEDKELRKFVTLPNSDNQGLGMLYAIVVVFDGLGKPEPGTASVETGLCFFDNHQIDRSPTGSMCVPSQPLIRD